jgi:serine/threonine protein phosphatase PrpC
MSKDFSRLVLPWIVRATGSAGSATQGNQYALFTDVGSKRVENQDRVVLAQGAHPRLGKFKLAVLADGMGGLDAGSECASAAIAVFLAEVVASSDTSMERMLLLAAHRANDFVFDEYLGRGGSTLSAALFSEFSGIWILNIGDSRVYVVRPDRVKQVTVDDTLAARLPAAARDDSRADGLLQYVGMGSGLQPAVTRLAPDLAEVLITSDGAHYVGQAVIDSIFSNADAMSVRLRRLVTVARWFSGHDNATAISMRVDGYSEVPDGAFVILRSPFGELLLPSPHVVVQPTQELSEVSAVSVDGSDLPPAIIARDESISPPVSEAVEITAKSRSQGRRRAAKKTSSGPEAESIRSQLFIAFEKPERKHRKPKK